MTSSVRMRLSVMMFLQYCVWGSWAVSLAGYLQSVLGFTGVQVGSIYATTAIAAMISPLYMGYLADRLFAAEKLVALMHLIGAGLLFAAARLSDFNWLYMVMIAYALCYMPTLALTNTIAMTNMRDPEKEFPGIRVWGTFGWIAAGWIVGLVLENPSVLAHLPSPLASRNTSIYMASALSAVLGLFSLVLPHTPPKAGHKEPEPAPGTNSPAAATGASIYQLLRDRTFLVFLLCSFLVCVPLAFYYSFANMYLQEIEAPYPAALQTIGQLSEVGFLAAMPWFIGRLGVKRMLLVGMLSWVVRYLCFGSLWFPFVLIGLILHGVCYDFFFVASQIYVDNRVHPSQRASAQSLIAFVTLGLGLFVGNLVAGQIVDYYPPLKVAVQKAAPRAEGEPLPKDVLPLWDDLTAAAGLKGALTLAALEFPEEVAVTDKSGKVLHVYQRGVLSEALPHVDVDANEKVTQDEWRRARAHAWQHIWFWPAGAAFLTCVLFWMGFKDQEKPAVPSTA